LRVGRGRSAVGRAGSKRCEGLRGALFLNRLLPGKRWGGIGRRGMTLHAGAPVVGRRAETQAAILSIPCQSLACCDARRRGLELHTAPALQRSPPVSTSPHIAHRLEGEGAKLCARG
jgi:hypothetical protein